jgi:hypothetical protein
MRRIFTLDRAVVDYLPAAVWLRISFSSVFVEVVDGLLEASTLVQLLNTLSFLR